MLHIYNNKLMRQIIILCLLLPMFATGQGSLPAYQLFDSNGKRVSFKKMVTKLADSDMVFFGELHDNAIAHWLELEVTAALHAERQLVLGAEMLETDNQAAANLYLAGEIDYRELDTLARLWPNHKTDYHPLLDFAKTNSLPFIATNVPRRYARQVYMGGFEALDTLPVDEKAWFAPQPMAFDSTLPSYVAMLDMGHGHGSMNMVRAQALKDATMANSILQHWQLGKLFVHYNGSYHSDYKEGIVWYVQQSLPEIRIVTITTVTQKDLSSLEEAYKGKADFILCVDEDMTSTY